VHPANKREAATQFFGAQTGVNKPRVLLHDQDRVTIDPLPRTVSSCPDSALIEDMQVESNTLWKNLEFRI